MAKAKFDMPEVVEAAEVPETVVELPKALVLKNLTRGQLVFNLPHETYCLAGEGAGPCACEKVTRLISEYNHRTEEEIQKVVDRLVCSSVSWLGGEAKECDPRVLNVEHISAAIGRGDLLKA